MRRPRTQPTLLQQPVLQQVPRRPASALCALAVGIHRDAVAHWREHDRAFAEAFVQAEQEALRAAVPAARPGGRWLRGRGGRTLRPAGRMGVVVLFRTERRADIPVEEYEATSRRMGELVQALPGFVSAKSYTAADGERVTVVRFASEEALEAWRTHPEHVAAQRRGREAFYRSYWVLVAGVIREYTFEQDEPAPAAEGRPPAGFNELSASR